MALDITFACYLYDRTIALQNGTVQPDGINLHYLQMDNLRDMFQRQARSAEFDACEMSFCTYVNLFSRGDRRMIAIPAFPSRKFRHSEIFINANAGIASPKDLMGKRIGVHDLNQTAGVWQRAHLEEPMALRAHGRPRARLPRAPHTPATKLDAPQLRPPRQVAGPNAGGR